jgi:hypothetical protein
VAVVADAIAEKPDRLESDEVSSLDDVRGAAAPVPAGAVGSTRTPQLAARAR